MRFVTTEQTSGGTGRTTITSIQYLRAIAALMVVMFHAQEMVPGFLKAIPSGVGNAGVDLFFTISGFVMVYVTASGNRSPLDFLAARIVRITPIYWLFIFASAFLMAIAPALFHANELSLRHLALSLFFIPHTISVEPWSIQPMVKAGWTLIYEMFFYLVFAVGMAVWFRARVVFTGGILLALVLAGTTVAPTLSLSDLSPVQFFLTVYGRPIVLEFVLGMMLAHVYLLGRLPALNPLLSGLLIVLSCLALLVGPELTDGGSRLAVFGIPAVIILASTLMLDFGGYIKSSRPFRLLGDASYSIYLVHMFPLALLRWAWPRAHMPVDGLGWAILFIAVSFAVTIPIGVACYLLLELPMLRRMRKMIKRKL